MTNLEIEKCICPAGQKGDAPSVTVVADIFAVECPECGRRGQWGFASRELAVEAWNRDMRGLRLLRELHGECGVEHDDPRLDYVTVQVPRTLWGELRARAALKEEA
jgi:hypothetical protein